MEATTIQFQATPEQAKDTLYLRSRIAQLLDLDSEGFDFEWKRRSIDARKKDIKINCTFSVYDSGDQLENVQSFHPINVAGKKEVAIIGSGPAGLFAALQALEIGLRPVIFERGKDVRSRRRDLADLNKKSKVNPESNYCFGEGGAGTYSDGKLYTRSKKRGDIKKALDWFVHFGATKEIMVDAHPHIGTNKLPQIIVAMRETIVANGGSIHFEEKVTDIIAENGTLKALEINHSKIYAFSNAIIATGHSARDIFDLFHRKKWTLKAKPFALGVRIEHPQKLIDTIQYNGRCNDEFLPPASYALVAQVEGRGVYSFCMCPGGIVAPCATDSEEVVTNGWSPSKRNNPYSNSGIVVSVMPEDFENHENDPFVCLNFQKEVEKNCWLAAGKTQRVPAQRMLDFMRGRVSKTLPQTSYIPGMTSVDLNEVLPELISSRLRGAFEEFGRKMNGYVTNDAVLHAPESRTSSPIQIPRGADLQHPDVRGLYPCGEGAGYAGGIISAAIDGMKCIRAIAEK
ncbi:FAD-binding protein [Crocinitomicaceae bacterium]|nr:FAD-binding protein [Crocinitomicaceae bacterium]